ncbi:MAG: rhombosortase [Gammaproteobacteria bacterium]|nr:rhombosortase [Gammaproteobacteria bacterium]NND60226.1 rhombosortase [Gammaproteobacteria bacterium]
MAVTGRVPSHSLVLIIVISAAILLIAALGDYGRDLLRYEREAVLAGAGWRLLTAHLAHLGWGHTILNLIGLWLAFSLFGDGLQLRQWAAAMAGALISIDLVFLLLLPQLQWYVGLSGVLHGLFAIGALQWMLQRDKHGYLLALLLAAKLAWEQLVGAVPLSAASAGGPVVVDAHLAGTVGGLLGGFVVLLRDWTARRR